MNVSFNYHGRIVLVTGGGSGIGLASSDYLRRTHGRLDVAHNNAGIEAITVPLAEVPSDNWRKVIDVNSSSVFYCLKAEIPVMVAQGGGASCRGCPSPFSTV